MDFASLIIGLVVFVAVLLVVYKIDQMLADIRTSRDTLARIADGIDKLNQQAKTAAKPATPQPAARPVPSPREDAPRRVIEIPPP